MYAILLNMYITKILLVLIDNHNLYTASYKNIVDLAHFVLLLNSFVICSILITTLLTVKLIWLLQ